MKARKKIESKRFKKFFLNDFQINHSNASHVWLSKVPLAISGKYACEVSADAPSFHTLVSFGEMDVVGKYSLLLL